MTSTLFAEKETSPTLSIRPTKSEIADFFGYAKTESLYPDIIAPWMIEECVKRTPLLGHSPIFTYDYISSVRCQRIPKPLRDLICEINNLPLHF